MASLENPETEISFEPIKDQIQTVYDFCSESLELEDLPDSDLVFVPGSRDPERAVEAAKLFLLGKAPKLVVSGADNPGNLPDGFETEADYYRSILIENGVSEEDVITEHEATNTLENVLFGIRDVRERGIDPKSVLLFSRAPHLRRTKATFAKQFPDIKVYPYGFHYDHPEKELKEGVIRRLVKEIDKYKTYAEKGDIVEIEVPTEVVKAKKEIEEYLEDFQG